MHHSHLSRRMHPQGIIIASHIVEVLGVLLMGESMTGLCSFAQDIQMEQSKGRIVNEWDILDEMLHRQEAAMPFSQFASRLVAHCPHHSATGTPAT